MHRSISIFILLGIFLPATLFAQGSIVGTVQRSTGGSPAIASFAFFGFLDNTDEEIRVGGADGSGYDGSNWWDDFQNYLTEGAGNPYDYYFFDKATNQSFHLEKLIPNNSFQVENITVAPAVIPSMVTIASETSASSSSVRVVWLNIPGLTYHIYRRPHGVNGSYFRRDDPTGNLNSHGVSDTFFVDTGVDSLRQFEFLVIGEDASGRYSPPSNPFSAASFMCGDADGSKSINLGDAVFIVQYIFGGGAAPNPLQSADADCSGTVNLSDAVYLVNYIFSNGAAPCAGC